MKRFWSWWVALLSREERGTVLALFRLAVGTVITVTLLEAAYSGVLDYIWVGHAYGGIGEPATGFFVLDWLGGPRPEVVQPLFAVAVLSALGMTAGLGGRWMILLAVVTYRSLSSIGHIAGGYDRMITNAGWLLVLGQATMTLSLDCRIRNKTWQSQTLIGAWPRFLAIGQLVLVYTATGVQKTSVSWSSDEGYSALFFFLQDPTWIRFDLGWMAHVYPLSQLATLGVWYFESFAVLLLVILYLRDTAERPGRLRRYANHFDLRKPWALFGIGMHLVIASLMNMGPFSWISLSYYICLVHPEELHEWFTRVTAKLPRSPSFSRA
ncbi:MAG: HTTM domain-containing protein [Myxococcota bacterium]